MTSARILIGDMRERLRDLPDNSVDAVVTDPPYHLTSIVKRFGSPTAAPLNNADAKAGRWGPYHRTSSGFMGQQWDGGDLAFRAETWAEVLRVLKPGGHLVAFGGTRTYHRLAVGIEDAGFELRDLIAWLYGSGFPKSHDVAKGLDRMAGASREIIGEQTLTGTARIKGGSGYTVESAAGNYDAAEVRASIPITAPATEEAVEWDGWGTALKPALEPIALARKPLSEKSVAANVLKWGTGALNVAACRIEAERATGWGGGGSKLHNGGLSREGGEARPTELGRWPANLAHDGSPEVLAAFPETADSPSGLITQGGDHFSIGSREKTRGTQFQGHGDSGSAARFFYCAKASRSDRGEGNDHPTVKPVALLVWLVRLITPPGGLVLDPFLGSGSVGIAAEIEQRPFIGVELRAEYAAIAERRMRDRAGLFAEVRVERLADDEGAAA
jgi:DNA modification methylase